MTISKTTNFAAETQPQLVEQNAFDRSEGYINLIFGCVLANTGMVSAFATFSGIRLFLEEVGQSSMLVNGTSVIITIATGAIVIVGWGILTRFGPEARGGQAKASMTLLGAALLIITLAVSSLSNMMALVGPAAKIHDWRDTHQAQVETVGLLESRALGVKQLLPGWRAEAAKACPAAEREIDGGLVSGTGRGAGPVAFALGGVCEQTQAFVMAMEAALIETEDAVTDARLALMHMRVATRDRNAAVVDREDRFLLSGDALTVALQRLRAADLTQVLDAGAQQVRASVSELATDSSFSAQQVETIAAIKTGISGLIASTDIITKRLREQPIPARQMITSPDYIEAVTHHAHRFVPVFAAALGIDLFALWALFFLLASKVGQGQSARSKPNPTGK